MNLFRWPVRGRVQAVTYTFLLAVVQGEPRTPLSRRTYPFTVIVDKNWDPVQVRQAIQLRANQMAADMAQVMEREVLAAIEAS